MAYGLRIIGSDGYTQIDENSSVLTDIASGTISSWTSWNQTYRTQINLPAGVTFEEVVVLAKPASDPGINGKVAYIMNSTGPWPAPTDTSFYIASHTNTTNLDYLIVSGPENRTSFESGTYGLEVYKSDGTTVAYTTRCPMLLPLDRATGNPWTTSATQDYTAIVTIDNPSVAWGSLTYEPYVSLTNTGLSGFWDNNASGEPSGWPGASNGNLGHWVGPMAQWYTLSLPQTVIRIVFSWVYSTYISPGSNKTAWNASDRTWIMAEMSP